MATETGENLEYIERLERLYEQSRISTLDDIARGTNGDWLMQNIRFGTQDPEQVWLKAERRRSNRELQLALKDLWWRTIEAAKLYPANDEMRQWKLVAWIAGAKARDPVPSLQQNPYTADDGKTLWKDLPFFQEALEQAWVDRTRLSKQEWHNLNAFVARLVDVTGIDLVHLGLETIREALEEPLPVFASQEGQHLVRSVSDLLPAALCWLKFSGIIFHVKTAAIERALKNGSEVPGNERGVAPGELASAGGVSRDGLSLARQRFWKLRLMEIGRGGGNGEDGDTTIQDARDYGKKLGTWNLVWPSDLKDVPGWEEPVKYQADA